MIAVNKINVTVARLAPHRGGALGFAIERVACGIAHNVSFRFHNQTAAYSVRSVAETNNCPSSLAATISAEGL